MYKRPIIKIIFIIFYCCYNIFNIQAQSHRMLIISQATINDTCLQQVLNVVGMMTQSCPHRYYYVYQSENLNNEIITIETTNLNELALVYKHHTDTCTVFQADSLYFFLSKTMSSFVRSYKKKIKFKIPFSEKKYQQLTTFGGCDYLWKFKYGNAISLVYFTTNTNMNENQFYKFTKGIPCFIQNNMKHVGTEIEVIDE